MSNTLSPHLIHELEIAHASLGNHPQFDLTIGHRYAIYRAMGDTLPSIPKEDRLGHLRRILLGLITVQHVLPIWEQALPDNALPHNAMKEVIAILEEPQKMETFAKHGVNYWDEGERLIYEFEEEGIDPNFIAVLLSASVGIQTLYDDILYPVEAIDYSITTFNNGDYYDFDGAEWAMVSYGGGSWLQGDPLKRREFWEWWLAVAVPQAFRLEFEVLRDDLWEA